MLIAKSSRGHGRCWARLEVWWVKEEEEEEEEEEEAVGGEGWVCSDVEGRGRRR